MADSPDLMRLLQDKHEAVRAFREAKDEDTRQKAWDGVHAASESLDAELVAREETRTLDQEKAAEELRMAALQGSTAGAAKPGASTDLNLDGIRAFARGQGPAITETMEYRTDIINEAANAYGSYLVPQSWASSVIEFQIADSGLLAAGPNVLTTDGGNQINMPVLVTDAATATGAEGTAATVSNVVWGTTPLNAYRFDGFFSVSNELLADTGVDLVPLLRKYAGRSIAAKVNPYFVDPDVGTGSSTIAAVQLGCTSALTAASYAVAPSVAELKQLYYSVLPVYRKRGKFVANSACTLAYAQLQNDNGDFMWTPQLAAAESDLLMGKPFYEDAYMDSIATGNEPIIFGDIDAGYTVRYAHGGMQFIVSKEFAVTSFETTFVWGIWLDGVATDVLAIKSITLP